MSAPEPLLLAQILADLNSLQNTDAEAAHALLRANKTLTDSLLQRRESRASILPDASFDSLGRRVKSSGRTPPSFSRDASSLSGKSRGSAVSLPGGNAGLSDIGEDDLDLIRAEELVRLHDKRGKFKQMGDTGLTRAKERVDAVIAKYAQQELLDKKKSGMSRQSKPGI